MSFISLLFDVTVLLTPVGVFFTLQEFYCVLFIINSVAVYLLLHFWGF